MRKYPQKSSIELFDDPLAFAHTALSVAAKHDFVMLGERDVRDNAMTGILRISSAEEVMERKLTKLYAVHEIEDYFDPDDYIEKRPPMTIKTFCRNNSVKLNMPILTENALSIGGVMRGFGDSIFSSSKVICFRKISASLKRRCVGWVSIRRAGDSDEEWISSRTYRFTQEARSHYNKGVILVPRTGVPILSEGGLELKI